MTEPTAPDQLFIALQQALAGRYSIDRELGRGGMGVVYLAREVHLDRLVAIKLLPPDKADGGLRERFLREARLAAKLSHPNIIPIHAVEDRGGFVFYVMAFVDGQTLAHRVRTRGPLTGSDGARILREVAWALAHAHAQGLVHRDVKPDNILLESTSGRVLVADFGIAAAIGVTGADGVAGTPEFMSPEQVLGKAIDARSDLYALGATGFYAFSGRFPFEGASATEILAKQVTTPAPPLASLGLPISRKVASIVDRCLDKDPARRPPSADALAEQLGIALEQRKEVPAALRSFVKRTARMNSGGTLVVGLLLLPMGVIVSAALGSAAGFGALAIGAIAAPTLYMISAARRLLAMGFDHADLTPAFKSESDQAREELATTLHGGPTQLDRLLPAVAKVSGGIGVVLATIFVVNMVVGERSPVAMFGLRSAFNLGLLTMAVAILSTFVYLSRQQQYRDVDADFWGKIWLGRLGTATFAIARRFTPRRATTATMTHRPTELSLGMAAEQLYESLPKESRTALKALPAVLHRLQRDAQTLRKRRDDLQEAVASASPGADYDELRVLRDAVHDKLGDAVGSLETIRLNLLRLHAGSGSVESLTTHLHLAAEVAEEVERLVSANADIERALAFPRIAEATPV